MPRGFIPLTKGLTGAVSTLGGGSDIYQNIWHDAAGTVKARPGTTVMAVTGAAAGSFSSFDSGAISIVDNSLYTVTPARSWWKKSAPDAPSVILGTIDGTARPTHAETFDFQLVVGGGEIYSYERATGTTGVLAARTATNEPPVATHVVVVSNYVIANDTRVPGRWRWSEPALPATWPLANNTNADARYDTCTAIYENAREVFIWGERSLQVYALAGTSSLRPWVPAAEINVGTPAPYSPILVESMFAYLDDRRRFVVSDGRGVEVISGQISELLRGLTTVNDAHGHRISFKGADILLWVFPTAKRAFAYDLTIKNWSDWTSWVAGVGAGLPWNDYVYWDRHNAHIILPTDLSTFGYWTLDADSRLDVGGTTVVVDMSTGAYNHGTDGLKACEKVRFIFRRGLTGGDNASSVIEVSHRDDMGAWSAPRRLAIGAPGETSFYVDDFPGGVYQRRQIRIQYSGAAGLELVSAEEFFEVLE